VLPAKPVLSVLEDAEPVIAPVLPVPWLALVGPQFVRLEFEPPLLVVLPVALGSVLLLLPGLDGLCAEALPELPELELELEPDWAAAAVARPSESAVTVRILVIIWFPLMVISAPYVHETPKKE
jgi:hypothetical protein